MNSNREFRHPKLFRTRVPLIVVPVIASIFAVAYITGEFSGYIYLPFYSFPLLIVFPLLIFALFYLGFSWCRWGDWRGSSGYNYDDPALKILRERLARGEVGKDQYEQMKKDLEAL